MPDITTATEADYDYIVKLSDAHTHELGFLPHAAIREMIQRRRMDVIAENADEVGFLFHGDLVPDTHIWQHCIQPDARGMLRGFRLVGNLMMQLANVPGATISLRCRNDLPSNRFWRQAGFFKLARKPGGKSKNIHINMYRMEVDYALRDRQLPYRSMMEEFHRLMQLPAGDIITQVPDGSALKPRTHIEEKIVAASMLAASRAVLSIATPD
jgi:hypothetical protein